MRTKIRFETVQLDQFGKVIGQTNHTAEQLSIPLGSEINGLVIKSLSTDEFLDELAKAHVLNMVPFESAKEYGSPINYWKDVIINFTF